MYLPPVSPWSWPHPPPYRSLNFPFTISVPPCSTNQILFLDCCMTYPGLPCFIIVLPYGTTQLFICSWWHNFSWICSIPINGYPRYHMNCDHNSTMFTSGCATSILQYHKLAVQVPIL
jgi:hypothetical protein